MIGIIDVGNAASVENALTKIGCKSIRSLDQSRLRECSSLILPGVGEFKEVMEEIRPIVPFIKGWGKPFLGICAGMQVLFEKSEESEGARGLGIIKGEVRKFIDVRTPQIGWNSIENVTDSMLKGGGYVYFVNSYYCIPKEEVTTSVANYGISFTASVRKNNFIGMQFHPEKSASYGLEILASFVRR